CAIVLVTCFATAAGAVPAAPQQAGQRAYPSPGDAVAALVAAVRANDRVAFVQVVGDALDQLASGDEVQDNLTLLSFAKRLLARVELVETDASTAVLYTGDERTLFK